MEFSRIIDQLITQAGDPAKASARDLTALPALHGADPTVLYEGRASSLADQMEADARHTAGVGPDGQPLTSAVLDAAHLVRGYRVVVGIVDPDDDATGRVTAWFPLWRPHPRLRHQTGREPPFPIAAAPDEGHVKATTVTHDQNGANELFVHQAFFGWHGWSLAAPPPGRTIGADNQPQVPHQPVSDAFPLDTTRPTAGTLPALRYGRTYRLRARLVDLAGNSPSPQAPAVEGAATNPITYARWEPVPPPRSYRSGPFWTESPNPGW
ncbi:hypothetical protein [Streptomyces syringium]|uniref:hypothetical protein n=1 Tax=Streptomyces syringium TaxID=76729 RepID=UPI0034101003